jgi:simple sugar transport system permease protein
MSNSGNLPVIVALLAATLRMATPLIFASLGGVFSERAGVVNIGLDGMMTAGAFFSIVATISTGNPWIGILAGIVAGALVALIHAVLSVSLRADQVVSGVAINLFAAGLSSFLIYELYKTNGQTQVVSGIPYPSVAIAKIPIIGAFLAELDWFVILAIVLVFVGNFVLYKTSLGLRIRSVGEHPSAADTVGINVYAVRYFCVILSGALAGLGGTYLSLGSIRLFRDGMVAGRGFIALAAMIFGNWKPKGALYACIFFGFAQALELFAQGFGLGLPTQVYQALPYILTMLALAGFVGKTIAPKADGTPYIKGER